MTKRIAEKVISRSILALAVYRKDTMSRALRRRPRFWTVQKETVHLHAASPRRRLRLEFGETAEQSRMTLTYEAGVQPSA